jgi:hypothetical protein
MPAVKVVIGNQFHLYVQGRRHSKGFPAGHADLILVFTELACPRNTRKWMAAFTILEGRKLKHDLNVGEGVLVSDTEGLYALSFDVLRTKPWPEIAVTFFPPNLGKKGQGVTISVVNDFDRKDVRLSRKPHPAQIK